jgi:hypothetical protein
MKKEMRRAMGLGAVDFGVAVSSAFSAGGDAAAVIWDQKHWANCFKFDD